MADKTVVDDFVAQKTLAIVGVSRSGRKFGNMIYKELRQNGYKLYPIHPQAETLEGDKAYKDFAALPEKVGGVIIVVLPARTEAVVRAAGAAGIQRVWMQQGAEDPEAIRFCEEHGIAAVHGHCVLMFLEKPGFPHAAHRFVKRITGSLPV